MCFYASINFCVGRDFKKTSRCRGDTGSDPETSKGRGEPFERVIVFKGILKNNRVVPISQQLM
jgi:hypothetical protein